MKKLILFSALVILSIILVSALDFTPQGTINMRGTYNIINVPFYNGTDINFSGLIRGNGSLLTGLAANDVTWISNWTAYNGTWSLVTNQTYADNNDSMKNYLDSQDLIFNNSNNNHISENNNSVNNYVVDVNSSMNNSIYLKTEIDAQNTSQTNYILENNNSVNNYIIEVNLSMNNSVYLKTEIDAINTSNNNYILENNGSVNNYIVDTNSTQATWVDNLFVRFTEIVDQVGNWSADKVNYILGTELNNGTYVIDLILNNGSYINVAETDPKWSSNFTNTQTDCDAGNYSYGNFANGTQKCRDDITGAAAETDPFWSANYSTFLTHIASVVEDTTPQLGGFLDANAQDIGSTSDEIENIYVGVTTRIYFGDAQESSIHYNGTALIISG
ncbi:hypothetical protein KAR91_07055 [Candidatus Pacearchaeota archaeon]|nr:hypothetical protein [Candidatus Pacearchaeota archaeon]